ncbi:hypothetical protein V496_07518 [Pseudogymnoascus sp. VKM F-4515 (FW-2607)]|nr:hypothetical protein V496_07518 [Pseudogymnoascus sp. VKM F-4515 (FW-2607)]KFY76344.1 hypothetical protein V498_09625 [Pseudogymnoascus sp. VKM F-4517 (FW-2822)]
MLLSQEIVLPCGLRFANRLSKAAMAENIAVDHIPNDELIRAYGEWSDGDWGMVMTGNVMVSDTHMGNVKDVAISSDASVQASKELQETWKSWADTCQRHGTPTVVQLCHPGRQSPPGAGSRGFFEKTIAPSAIKLDFGPRIIDKLAVSIAFGTPREMTVDEISGDGGLVDQFVAAAKQCFDSGFKGVELHAAHGYLLAQFLSSQSNVRTDEFGGSPAKRVEIVLRIIRAVRSATSKDFCIGIKMNSVDAASSASLSDTMEQIKLVADCGIDFIEVSGGTYENPKMMAEPGEDSAPVAPTSTAAGKTFQRESFFLEFAKTVRETFPDLVLMVTGGFRTRLGMEHALKSGGCDIVGIGRPAAVVPRLPKEIILNTEDVTDEQADVSLARLQMPLIVRKFGLKQVGAGVQSAYYGEQIGRMGRGLAPIDNRIQVGA